MVKNLPASAGDIRDLGSILGLGRSPGGRDGNPLQYSCLKNPMDRGAWWATVHIVEKSQRQLKQLSMHVNLILLRPFLGIAVTIDSILLKSCGLQRGCPFNQGLLASVHQELAPGALSRNTFYCSQSSLPTFLR